jgi:hypothetical protein
MADAHVFKELTKKLDAIIEKFIFLGYNDDSNAYKLYNPMTKSVIINKNVVFKGDKTWDGSIDKIICVGAVVAQVVDEVEEQIT